MKKHMVVGLSGVGVLLSAAQVQAAPVTNITVNNDRSTSVTRTGTLNVSGYLSPLPQTTIPAGGFDAFGSYTSGTADAGVLYYGGCRFNWSKIQNGGVWTFSLGATPASTCVATSTVKNPFTGDYSITLTTN
jgi:hypothetical protein